MQANSTAPAPSPTRRGEPPSAARCARAVVLYLMAAVAWGLLAVPLLRLAEVSPELAVELRFWGLLGLGAALMARALLVDRAPATAGTRDDERPGAAQDEVRAIDASPLGVFHFDRELRVVRHNPRFAELLRTGADQLAGLDLAKLPDQAMLPALRAALAGQSGQYDGPFAAGASGRSIHIGLRATPLLDDDGRVRGGVAIVEDLTTRHEAEAMLRESETRYALAMRATNEGLWDWNPITHGLSLSSRLLTTALGMESEHLATNSDEWLARIHLDDRPRFREQLIAHLKGLTPYFECEYRVLDIRGHYRWVLARGLAQRDRKGVAYRMVGSIGDITERKHAEDALKDLNRELELRVGERTEQLGAALKELEAFSYSVSHDLRTPLRAIDGYSAILMNDYGEHLDDEARGLLTRMRAAVQRMGDLIDDLLNLARVSRQPLVRRSVDLSNLAAGIVRELQEGDPARQVRVDIAPDLRVDADPGLLTIALHNLFANAWKFTGKKATPTIRLYPHPRERDTLCIEDNGAGFDMHYAGKLFGAFQRLHPEREFPGTGIGLATVARIVQRHGGRISAFGEPGKGARFDFSLGAPLQRAACAGDEPGLAA